MGHQSYPCYYLTLIMQSMTLRLFLLCLLMAKAHTYRIPERSDPYSIYYMNGNTRCLKCSPGTFVYNHCTTSDTMSTCVSCAPGETYSDYATAENHCFACTVCRNDQEEVSPCTVTMNTKCRCKKGMYCPPDSPCEMCQKCTTSCPPNEVIQTPCNSTSDTRCGPPENDSNTLAFILVPVTLLIIGVVALICFCCYKKKCTDSKLLPKILTISSLREEAPAEDPEIPFLYPQLQFNKNLSTEDKDAAITETFNTLIDKIPAKKFDKFVLRLGLNPNDVDRIKMDISVYGMESKQFEMLKTLHQDNRFNVNNWLDKLRQLKMREVATVITNELIASGNFELSTEE